MSAPAGRPLRADAVRNRNAVVQAARRAFVDRGVEAPLEDIAKSAGVGPGTLYRHFPTRSDLIAAAVEDHVEELRRAVDRLNTPSYDASDVLRDWVRLLSDYSDWPTVCWLRVREADHSARSVGNWRISPKPY